MLNSGVCPARCEKSTPTTFLASPGPRPPLAPPWPPLAPPWPLLAPLVPPCPSFQSQKNAKKAPRPLTPWPLLAPPRPALAPPGPPWPPLARPGPPPGPLCPSSVLSGLLLSTKLAVELLYWWELRATALNPKRQWFGWWPVKAHSGREKKPSTNENCWTALQINAFA